VAPRTSIRVVSLARSHDRRQAFRAGAAATRLPWSFFDAHETIDPALSYDPVEAIVAGGGTLLPAELGCYSSHYTIWREFLASGHDQLVVLEDDVVVDWGYLEFLIGHDLEKLGIRYLRLYAARPAAFRHIATRFLEFSHDLIQFKGYAWGSQGYLLTRAGAVRFVPHFRRIRRSFDSELDRAWDHGVANLAVFPFPLLSPLGSSMIGPGRYEPQTLSVGLRARRLPFRALERTRRVIGDMHNRPFRLTPT
jgi:glycosyl transferase family 25